VSKQVDHAGIVRGGSVRRRDQVDPPLLIPSGSEQKSSL
jgi:hypothetical protein